jgi:excisionase family DNA binding protein
LTSGGLFAIYRIERTPKKPIAAAAKDTKHVTFAFSDREREGRNPWKAIIMGNSVTSDEILTHKLALSIADASQLSNVGRSQLYEAIAGGELRAVKRGRSTLILPDDLKKWINGLPAFSAETKSRQYDKPTKARMEKARQSLETAERRTAARTRRANVEARTAG